MKAKLIKRENHYDLFEGTRFISTTDCEDGTVNKLSKQNCNEIFGVVTPEAMMKDIDSNCEKTKEGFVLGFLMASELNKDKVFTLQQIVDCWNTALKFQENGVTLGEFIQSLRPTEIEVEIEMEVADLAFYENGERYPIEADLPERFKYKSKLDADGCLILKKKGGCY
jgi:hypothetical protein